MVSPDKELIARVKLYSQGFKTAEHLSGKIVSLFDLCLNQLSAQSHYDFGLRALKSVLVSAGNLKRAERSKHSGQIKEDEAWEQELLLRSLCGTLVPKLVAQDIPLLESLLSGVFPGASLVQIREDRIKEELHKIAPKYNMLMGDRFVEKVL
jgi:dynein heavy chain 1